MARGDRSKACLTTRVVTGVLLLLTPVIGQGQLVRGAVQERTTGVALPGVLVTLERLTTGRAGAVDTVRTVLSDARGGYAVYAPAAGRFRLSVKRIGVRPFVSAAFELAEGMTHRLDVALDLQAATVAEVVVKGATPCATRRENAARVASLWEDTRAALTATAISVRDSLVRARFIRFLREIDPRNLEVLSESLIVFDSSDVGTEPDFRSPSGDSLSRMGYWRRVGHNSTVFYAPDAHALLSEAFVNDHCFDIVAGTGDRAGLIGLTFQPTQRRALPTRPPDIRGTIWLDAKSIELRLVEFTWTRLPGSHARAPVGGAVYFTRIGGGPWIIPRWSIRMPRDVIEIPDPAGGSDRAPGVRLSLIEEGGIVGVDSLRLSEKPGTITGMVRDSAGKPFAGVQVRLVGTSYTAQTDADGRFILERIPPGWHTIAADHDAYRIFDIRVGQMELLLDEGATRQASFRAPGANVVRARLCSDSPMRRSATLRVKLVDQATQVAVGGAPVVLRASLPGSASDREASADNRYRFVTEDETDAGGSVTFCGVPADTPLLFAIRAGDGQPVVVGALQLKPNEIAARVFRR